jgi:hypothetical protein
MELTQEGIQYLENSIDRGRPVPGQSLTNSTEQPYNWERSPEITDPREGMYVVFDALIEPETVTNILSAIDEGVGVIDIASMMLYTGFIEGKWNPDLMLLLMEPTMYMIMALSEKAEIEYVLETGDELLSNYTPEPDKTERMKQELISLEELTSVKKQAASKVNEQSIPKELKEKLDNLEIQPSLLSKKINKRDSLLNKEV